MKYVVFLGDGMADTPVEALEGKTPLMVAKKENIDSLAPLSEVGLAKTIPDGMKPGSDTANLSVMGYDPRVCYSGRSPLEALSMGLTMSETDIAVRCNLVTLSSEEEHYADKRMIDYSAGEISSEEARELIEHLQANLGDDRISFHPGISYRHCLIVHDATTGSELTPPHDITGKLIKRHLPSGVLGELFLDLQLRSYDLLKDHPINLKRIAEGKNPANSIWLWGDGTKPNLPDFREKNGIKGAVISAVDLLKGIGKGAGMKVINVKGATGNMQTDFAAKGKAAIKALKSGIDYVYIHVEAPDESGHQGSLSDKITSIEKIDAEIVGPVLSYLKECGEPYHVLVCPDHPTPLATRTHSSDPVPYLIYRSDALQVNGPASYDEETAKSTGIYLDEGFHLIDRLLSNELIGEKGISPTSVITPESGEEILLTGNEKDAEESASEKEEKKEESEEDASDEKKEKTEKKPKKKGRFARFVKKHLLLCIVTIAVILLAAGLTAGHFISTYHMSFVRSESDLKDALSKSHVKTIVLKKNVTVSSDLVIPRSVDLDLNEYTLTVRGELSLPLEKDVAIGYKKSGSYVKGGKIVADAFSAEGTGNLRLYADLVTEEVDISASKVEIRGNICGTDPALTFRSQEVTMCGDTSGAISLGDASVLTLSGSAKAIAGGKTVTIKSGTIGKVTDSESLYIHEAAAVESAVNVGALYYVTRLAAPEKLLVTEEDGDFFCYISEVIGATRFAYYLNGVDMGAVDATAGGSVIQINADDLTPGKHTITVYATAGTDPRYLDSEAKSCTFEFSAKLNVPKVSVHKEGDKVILTVQEVKRADKYAYTVDAKPYSTETKDTDITEAIAEGGVHIIEVKAQSNNRYFQESNIAMTSYVTYLPLETSTPTIQAEGEEVTFSWEAVTGAKEYLIRYGTDEIHTTKTEITLTLAEDADFTIRAIGSGFYSDDEIGVKLLAKDIAAAQQGEEQ